ncbi:hypothetical protein Poly59_60170 [Rubripirellula reticaptiva]|uniref:Uncharacterized protein n=1 Tax=Rubripirellula reticaptiva TaxID=2528013 RepID=A0A5C6EBB3_9BACT|nr:hypothetical protein Poly59_60170 [Rubripirellula reticaptiva]
MLDWIKVAGKFAYDRPTRERLLGYRPVVIWLIESLERKAGCTARICATRNEVRSANFSARRKPESGILAIRAIVKSRGK